jgi:hypothetical protein
MTTHITKTWFDGEKVVTQEMPESEVYKQERVAYSMGYQDGRCNGIDEGMEQPQREWVGLTPHERVMCRSYDIDEAIANTEAKLKEKNT